MKISHWKAAILVILLGSALSFSGCAGLVSSGSEASQRVAPSITSQPANQTVRVGQTATFIVVATGTSPLSYQWQKNGNSISGANAPRYTTPPVTSVDNGAKYHVVITNPVGSMASSPTTLTVDAASVTLDSISVSPSNPSINQSQTQQFTATGTYSDGSTKDITASVTWASSNVAVAAIGVNSGFATGVAAGSSQITATLGSVVSPVDTLTVIRSISLQSIAVSPANPSINQSQTQQFTATGTYSDGSTKSITTSVTWASSNTAVAAIGLNTGLATGITAGTSKISATLGSVSSASNTITVVKSISLQSIAVTPANPSINQSQTQQFTATGTYSDGSTKDVTTSVSWTSSNTAVVSIGVNTGLAAGITPGTSQITATLGSVASAGHTLTIIKPVSLKSIAVTPSNPSINQSQTQQFTATGTYSDGSTKNITTSVSWTSSNTAVAAIGLNTGLATGITAGTSKISATLGSVSSASNTITVVKSISLQSIAVTPATPSINQSQTQQFTATGTYSDGSTKNITTSVSWTSSNTAVASIGVNTGLASGIAAGTSQIVATLGSVTSTARTLTVVKSISLQSIAVTPATPSINQSQTQQFTATGTYSDGSTKNITTSVSWTSSNTAVASIGVNTGLASGIAAGTSQIVATLGSITSTARTLTVVKSISLQSIAVTPATPSINQSQTQQFTATGTYSDGSNKDITASVSWTSSNTSVASIGVNTGLASSIAAGTSQIVATLGSVTSTARTLTVVKSISLQSIAVTPATPSINQSQTQQFAATGTYSDGSTKNITTSVSWTSSNTAVASIGVNTGLASGIAAGTSQIVATLGSVTSTAGTLTVVKSISLQSIAITPAIPSINQSQTQQFAATGTYSDGSNKDITASVSWTSSNTSVASIGVNTGLASGIAAGTSQIVATLGSITSTAHTLTVIKSVSLQSIAVTPANPSINQSQTQQFAATGTYSDGSTKDITTSVSWTSSNTSVASIGVNTGLATGIAAGTSQITATLGSVVSTGRTLTVIKSVSLQSIVVSPSNPSISESQTQQFTATGTYSDGSTKSITTSITWASSNTSVASIGVNTGLATGIAAGTSQITATLGSVVSTGRTLTVIKSVSLLSIAVSPSNPSINQSQTQQFTATGTYSDGSTKNITTSVSWTSSNTAVASMGVNTGLSTGVAAGSSQITAILGSITSPVDTLTVVKSVTLQSIAVTPSSPSINPSQTQQFTATGTYSDGSTKDVTTSAAWASSNASVASIGANTGLATGVAAGTAKITASLGSVASVGDTLTVKAAALQSIAVSPASASINQSQTQQFTATGTYSDGSTKDITTNVTWTSSNTGVATIGANSGLAAGVSAGSSQITATLGSVASSGHSLSVNAVTLQSITVAPANPSISKSQTQQFTATGSYSDGSNKDVTASVTWQSSNTAVATIGTNSGLATGIAGGASQITATLGGVVSASDILTVTTSGNSYTTNFPLTEDPISEGGKWINGKVTGIDWANVRTTPGLAFGTQTDTVNYDDTTAILAGSWGPNQMAQATVHTVNQNSGMFEEVELRLRTSISAHSITGYEINFRCTSDGTQYVQLVRWNGPLGDFSYISGGAIGPGLHDGDIIKATIIGSTITAYINGKQIAQGNDSTYTSGSPGMGFYIQGGKASQQSDYGFKSFTASDLP